jgi:hypothetical protein
VKPLRTLALAISLIIFISLAASAESGSAGSTTLTKKDSESRCQTFMQANPDLVCLSLASARALDVKVVTLQHDLDVAKLKSKRLGLTLGCGLGLSATVDEKWTAHYAPAATCAAVYGWRW